MTGRRLQLADLAPLLAFLVRPPGGEWQPALWPIGTARSWIVGAPS